MDIKELNEQKEVLSNQLTELSESLEEGQVFSDEQLQQWDAVQDELVQLNKKIETEERLLSLVKAKSQPQPQVQAPRPTVAFSKNVIDEGEVFRGWCLSQANRQNEISPRQLSMIDKSGVRLDSPITGTIKWNQTKGTDANGGFAVNDGIVAGIVRKLKDYSGMLNTAHVFNTASGENIKKVVFDSTNAAATKTAELGTISNTTQTLGSVVFKSTELTSACYEISHQLVRDSSFDVLAEFQAFVAESFGRAINSLCTTGDGTDEPLGIETAISTASVTPTAIDFDSLLDLYHSVDSAYRNSPKCVWMMNDATMKATKKVLVDLNDRPMYNNSVNNSVVGPAAMMIEGKPVVINNDCTDDVILFGDFDKFHIRMVANLQIRMLYELFALKNALAIVGHQAVDSRLVDAGAIKKLVVTEGE